MSDNPKVDANELPKTEPEVESNELSEQDLSKVAGGLRKANAALASGAYSLE
jgi:hypothetical protein